MKKEQRMMLQGGVTYDEGRERDREYIASIMYEYPKVEKKIIEMPLEYYNPMPVYTIEKPVIVREERKEEPKTNSLKAVRRNEVKIPARERIDYINKAGNVRDMGVPQENENVVMKAKVKKVQAPAKDYNEIANLMYPTMEEKSQIQVKKKEPILLGETSILKEPDMITLADKEYVVKPLDGTFTGAAASVITNREENIPIKYTNIDMLLPYLSGKESIMKHIETPPYKPYNDINLIKSLLLNYKNIANWGEYNSTFSDDLKEKLKQFLRKEEGLKLKAYKIGKDVWTIGYGHTQGVKAGDQITKEKAEELLEQDINEHIKQLKIIEVPLSDNQKIAMASLAFNLGGTKFRRKDLIKYINNGDYENVAKEFGLIVYSANGKDAGLVNRRKREKELFFTPD
ncbi:MAG: lysozyme [Candidatus Avigastranaerophilus sp.]